MSIAKSVRTDGDKLVIEDEDGRVWQYARGKEAGNGATPHVDWTWSPLAIPPKLVTGPDGTPLLCQVEKGLPKKIIVAVAGKGSTIPGSPGIASWGGGRYEFEQVMPVVYDPRLLRSIAFGNFLSFGPEMWRLPLGNLNVLIGPNGSGKSNVLEAISLLRSAPKDLRPVILRGGGVQEWIWKGAPNGNATLEAIFANPIGTQPLRHVLAFRTQQQSFRLEDERIENELPSDSEGEPHFYYRYQQGRPVVTLGEGRRDLPAETVRPDLSILAQLRDPKPYPEITYLASIYDRVRLYREWAFGRNTIFREPQKADLRNDLLEEDFSNLGLFLNRMRRQSKIKTILLSRLRDLYQGLTDFDISVEGGTVQVFFTEGDFTIPATRLSDGSLRYLCLLAILCDPEPPPLIGLEEPELGLHPDLLPKVADMLVAAAQRTQLIVTTHSDILVDALTERPETLVICEKHDGRTALRRLAQDEVQPWVENYRLGQLWTQGHLGGTRW